MTEGAAPHRHRDSGFTLIEIMIAVLILGILLAIAVPTYQGYVEDSRRSECASALVSLAQTMERHYTEETTYLEAAQGGNDTGAPANFSDTCPVGANNTTHYNLRITAATQNTYTLEAQPVNAQAGDECGTLTLDQTGQRGLDGAEAGVNVDDCW